MNKSLMLTCLHSTDPCGLTDTTTTIYANQPLLKMESVKIVSMILSSMGKICVIVPHFFMLSNNNPPLTKRQVITQVSVSDGNIILLRGLAEAESTHADTRYSGSVTDQKGQTISARWAGPAAWRVQVVRQYKIMLCPIERCITGPLIRSCS